MNDRESENLSDPSDDDKIVDEQANRRWFTATSGADGGGVIREAHDAIPRALGLK